MGRRVGITASPARRHARTVAAVVALPLALVLGLPACSSGSSPPVVDERIDTTVLGAQPAHPDDPITTATEPDGPSTTWEPAAPCTVSALLVPSCGAWLGASTPSRDGVYNYTVGLAEYEQVADNPPDILHFYKKDGTPFPTDEEIGLAEGDDGHRSLLFYNWKPSTQLSWKQVADWDADAAIVTIGNALKQYDHKLFLAIWHEPENDRRSKGSPEDYVAMYRHVVDVFDQLGVDNVVYVMNYMGFAVWKDVVDDYYPGDDVVDWIAYDPYGVERQDDIGMVLDVAVPDWAGFYSWATAKAPGTPIMLGEWGIDLRRQPNAAAVLDSAVPILEDRFPMIKAFVYWNDYMDNVVVRLDEPTTLGRAYAAAYRRFAQNPYFNSTDPSLAP